MRRTGVIYLVVVVVVLTSVIWYFTSRSTPTPTYPGGGASATTTTSPSTTTTKPGTTTTTLFTTGPSGPDGINDKGSVIWSAAQWVTNYYSEFYKWPNILHGEDVLAKPFETPSFYAYDSTHNGTVTSPGSKNAWTLLTVGKTGIYPYISDAELPEGVGTCALHCVVQVTWTYGSFTSSGTRLPPVTGAAVNAVSVSLTKVGRSWLVSAEPSPLGN
jgi:hypothetical protein